MCLAVFTQINGTYFLTPVPNGWFGEVTRQLYTFQAEATANIELPRLGLEPAYLSHSRLNLGLLLLLLLVVHLLSEVCYHHSYSNLVDRSLE